MSDLHSIKLKSASINGTLQLPGSKSESNRVLVVAGMAGLETQVGNLAPSDDTKLMVKLLKSGEDILDAGMAGTTYRFLTALLAAKGEKKILTGAPRMKERPIGQLVDALKTLGADIEYLEKDGYPPLQFNGGKLKQQGDLKIDGNVSSQFISALILIAPFIEGGLKIELTGQIVSVPYIEMTLEVLKRFGLKYTFEGNFITIPEGLPSLHSYTIEADWSSASYAFELVALADEARLEVPFLIKDSLQGDSAIVEIMENLGVSCIFNENGAILTKMAVDPNELTYDFTHCPDLAQTVVATCVGLKKNAKLSGIHHLRFKETDRIKALQNEIAKFGATLEEKEDHFFLDCSKVEFKKDIQINTYHDHRMALAFAPLVLKTGVIAIEDIGVVTKSFPGYFEMLAALNIIL
jgi:3-phosphoshikimate 1-carboxyvinyltransferase